MCVHLTPAAFPTEPEDIHMVGEVGATGVQAWCDGVVVNVGNNDDGYGHYCIIEHTNGISTLYGHMIVSPFVVVGQQVEKGQTIGLISSAEKYQASHVHFATNDAHILATATLRG